MTKENISEIALALFLTAFTIVAIFAFPIWAPAFINFMQQTGGGR